MAKKLTKTQTKKKYMTIVNATKRLADDKMSQPRSHVTMTLKNLMAVNEKLIDRGTRIISELTGLDYEKSKKRLYEADKSVKIAIVMEELNCSKGKAKKTLERNKGFLRGIIN